MEQRNKIVRDYEMEIDIKEVFFALLQKWYVIALTAVLMASLFLGVSKFAISEKFESKTSIYILNQRSEDLTYSDLQLGTILTKDYEVLIKSRTVLEEVIKNLKLSVPYEVLSGMVRVSVPESTRIVQISVRTTSPELSQKIADEVREVASENISNVMNVDAVKVVDKANFPTAKCSPNVTRNTILGGFFGGLISSAIILVFAMLNDTIHNQEDVEKYLGLNTLGVIPFSEKGKNKHNKKRVTKSR